MVELDSAILIIISIPWNKVDQNPVDICKKDFFSTPIPPTNPDFQMDGEKLLPDAQNTTTLYGLRLFIPNHF